MAGKKYVDKIRTKRNMTNEEKQWYQTVHDKDSKVIEKKRAFLLFLISMLKNHDKYLFQDTGKCLDAIKKAEDKEEEEEKNNNINLNKIEISRSTSQNVGKDNIYEHNKAEKKSKNNTNTSITNNKINEIYNKEIKEINNDKKKKKNDINNAIKENNI